MDRRIGDRENLIREVAAWKTRRNAAGAGIKWMFTVEKARKKMNRAYPEIVTGETNDCAMPA